MNAVECSEIQLNGPEDGQSAGHLQRAAWGHGDSRQLKERKSPTARKCEQVLPLKEGRHGEFSFQISCKSKNQICNVQQTARVGRQICCAVLVQPVFNSETHPSR